MPDLKDFEVALIKRLRSSDVDKVQIEGKTFKFYLVAPIVSASNLAFPVR